MAHRYLVGENVRLRNVEAADVDFLCEIENDSQNWNVSDTLAPYSRTTMEEYIQSERMTMRGRMIVAHIAYTALLCRRLASAHMAWMCGRRTLLSLLWSNDIG
jgi:hypothetical protein